MPFWTDDELESCRRRVAMVLPGEPAGLLRDDALALLGELTDLRARFAAGGRFPSRAGWVPSDAAVDLARSVFFESLPPLALEGLTGWLTRELARGSESRTPGMEPEKP